MTSAKCRITTKLLLVQLLENKPHVWKRGAGGDVAGRQLTSFTPLLQKGNESPKAMSEK